MSEEIRAAIAIRTAILETRKWRTWQKAKFCRNETSVSPKAVSRVRVWSHNGRRSEASCVKRRSLGKRI
jgi:hypothetical protein